MASLSTDLSNLPSFDINQYSNAYTENRIHDKSDRVDGVNEENDFVSSEEFSSSLESILNGQTEDKHISKMSASDAVRDDTMEDALTQMELALQMKNVDSEDQAQAAMLADALISKVMRTHVDGNGNGNTIDMYSNNDLFKDPSLWRAHSVLAEVSQIGVWSRQQARADNKSSDPSYHARVPVTDMKVAFSMIEASQPIGSWHGS